MFEQIAARIGWLDPLDGSITTAMPTPTNPPLHGYRIIPSHPPNSDEFIAALAKKIADVNNGVARELWKMVYDRGRDLPATVVDQ